MLTKFYYIIKLMSIDDAPQRSCVPCSALNKEDNLLEALQTRYTQASAHPEPGSDGESGLLFVL